MLCTYTLNKHTRPACLGFPFHLVHDHFQVCDHQSSFDALHQETFDHLHPWYQSDILSGEFYVTRSSTPPLYIPHSFEAKSHYFTQYDDY